MGGASGLIIGIVGAGSLLLIWGGVRALRKKDGDRTRPKLMIAIGIITLLNLLMWATMPDAPPVPEGGVKTGDGDGPD